MFEMQRLIYGEKLDIQEQNSEPRFWHSVLQSYDMFKKMYIVENRVTKRFDMLFGFTYCLSKDCRWLGHNESCREREKIITGLDLRWKHVLRYSFKELGIDGEFSLPAVLHLVEAFKNTVKSGQRNGGPML